MPIDAPKEELEEKPTVTVSGGRRRGRRKVNKKKTMKDAEGYLGELYRLAFGLALRSMLTQSSHERGSCVGIIFRGRASPSPGVSA